MGYFSQSSRNLTHPVGFAALLGHLRIY